MRKLKSRFKSLVVLMVLFFSKGNETLLTPALDSMINELTNSEFVVPNNKFSHGSRVYR